MDYGTPEPMQGPTIKIQAEAEGGDCSDERTASMAMPFLKLVSVLASHSLKAMRRPSVQMWCKTLGLHAGEPQLAGSSSTCRR